jgi:flagellar protein FlbD
MDAMIILTRLNGPAFALNPDLIERAEETPDTVVTLVDGKHYLIKESLKDLIEIIRNDRASVLALARDVSDDLDAHALVTDPDVIQLKPRH